MTNEKKNGDTGTPKSNEIEGEQPVLTTRQGHPVVDNQSVRTVGERGPTTLENYHFIEKITHFDIRKFGRRTASR
jgi:catalase